MVCFENIAPRRMCAAGQLQPAASADLRPTFASGLPAPVVGLSVFVDAFSPRERAFVDGGRADKGTFSGLAMT